MWWLKVQSNDPSSNPEGPGCPRRVSRSGRAAGASEAVRTQAGLRPGGWRASRAHSPGPGAHCSRAEGGRGWLLPEVGSGRVVLTAFMALAD